MLEAAAAGPVDSCLELSVGLLRDSLDQCYADWLGREDPVNWLRDSRVGATGLRLQLPPRHVGLVWPRSGLAVRHGIDTLAGVIDSDYRGEVRVVLVNHGREPFRIAPGDRVAQLLLQRVERAAFVSTDALEDTERAEGGFGSTGR